MRVGVYSWASPGKPRSTSICEISIQNIDKLDIQYFLIVQTVLSCVFIQMCRYPWPIAHVQCKPTLFPRRLIIRYSYNDTSPLSALSCMVVSSNRIFGCCILYTRLET